MNTSKWTKCESRSDMEARLSSIAGNIFDLLMEDQASSWGYLTLVEEGYSLVPIGFCDVGLQPRVSTNNKMVFVGIGSIIAGYELKMGKLVFIYKMPTIFHEFLTTDDQGVIVQDETGFVGLDLDGTQKWIKLYSDIIDTYDFDGRTITGKTFEGSKFEFSIP